MVSTIRRSPMPWWPISRPVSWLVMTPTTSPPAAMTASATVPISPTWAPP